MINYSKTSGGYFRLGGINFVNNNFNKDFFFIKLSPINKNKVCERNKIKGGVFKYEKNII